MSISDFILDIILSLNVDYAWSKPKNAPVGGAKTRRMPLILPMKPHLPLSLLKTLLATAAVAVTVTLCAVTYEPSASAAVPAGTSAVSSPAAHPLTNTVSFSSALQGTDQEVAQQAVITAEQTISRTFSYCSLSFDTPQASTDAEISVPTSAMPAMAEGSTPVSTISAYPVGAGAPAGVGGSAGVALASAGGSDVTPLTAVSTALESSSRSAVTVVSISQDDYKELSDAAKDAYRWNGSYHCLRWWVEGTAHVCAGVRYHDQNNILRGGLGYAQGGASVQIINGSYGSGTVSPVYVVGSGSANLSGETSLSHNTSSQGGAVYVAEGRASFTQGNVTLAANSAYTGGAVWAPTLSVFDSGGDVIFSSNTANEGGAVSGQTVVTNVKTLIFRNNQAKESGGALLGGANISYVNNLEATGNVVDSSESTYAYGGWISDAKGKGVVLDHIDQALIADNRIMAASAAAPGGAVYTEGTMQILHSGKIEFRGNTAYAGASLWWGTSVFGGAIRANLLEISDGDEIVFSGNEITARGGNYSSGCVSLAYGGAIDALSGMTIENYRRAEFSDNAAGKTGSTDSGAEYYSGGGAVRGNMLLRNAEEVLFRHNTTVGCAEANGGAVLGNVTAEGVLSLVFSENQARRGGAVYGNALLQGRLAENGEQLSHLLFENNSADSGSAVYGDINVTDYADAVFSGNITGSSGSLIQGSAEFSNVNRVIFADNSGASVISGDAVFTDINELQLKGANTFVSGHLTMDRVKNFTLENLTGRLAGNGLSLSNYDSFLVSGYSAPIVQGAMSLTSVNSAVFEHNTGVAHSGSFKAEEVGVLTFSDNQGGALYNYSSLSVREVGQLQFSDNTSADGGAIYSSGTASLTDNGNVSFSGNSANTGGAIHNRVNFTLSNNECVTFSENTANSVGGAICNVYSTFTISNNKNVTFTGNTSQTTSWTDCEGGGAIHNAQAESFLLSDNESITFSANSTTGSGGAICNNYFQGNSNFTIRGNGTTTFSANSAGVNGGAIYSYGGLTLSGNADFFFNGNSAASGGAIYSMQSFSFQENGNITFSENRASSGNGGAICGSFDINQNGVVTFIKNSSSASGGAIYNSGGANLDENRSVIFSSNSAQDGGAIYYVNSTFSLNGSENVIFSANTVSHNGGAIYCTTNSNVSLSNDESISFNGNIAGFDGGAIFNNYGKITLNSNGEVTFADNMAESSGGAIHNYGSNDISIATFTLQGNTNIVFRGNMAKAGGAGAIYNCDTYNRQTAFTLSENECVTFSENASYKEGGAVKNENGYFTLNSNGSVSFNGNSSGTSGGAIYNYGTFSMLGNDAVSFTGNTAGTSGGAIDNRYKQFTLSNSVSVLFSGNSAQSAGGAIRNGATFTLTDNSAVTFSGNSSSSYGGAINNNGTFTLSRNGDVLFEKNVEESGSIYRLRSIYSEGTLNLAASEGKNIIFRDSVYASGTVNLNQDYTDSAGATHKSTGDIIFTGATTETDLREMKGGVDGTAEELLNSRSSVLDAAVTLNSGTLRVEDGASLTVKNLTAANGSALVLHDASFTATGNSTLAAVTISGNTVLTAQTGATLTLQQALTNSGTLTVGGTLNVSDLTLTSTSAAATYIDVNGDSGDNGFLKDNTSYSVQVVNGGTVVNNNATVKHGTRTLTLNSDGTATGNGMVDYGTYYINGGSASLAAIKAVASSAKVQMTGGCLTIDTNTATEILHDNTAALNITIRQDDIRSYAGYGEIAFDDISHTSHGGAINLSRSKSLILDNNGALVFRNNSANGDGGVIENAGSVSLRNNGVVTFAGNRATSHGGAIDNWGGTCILEDNQNVTFRDNRLTSTYGAAIYNSGTLTLRGNGDVLFAGNAEISKSSYRLRSIYSKGTLNLSAAEGKSILFRDSVYASGTVNLNADGAGDIIFTGATTEADLQEVKGGVAGTATEIENSRSSILEATVTLYGGTLQVRDGASLTVKNLTAANGATLMLHDASFTTTGDSTPATVTVSGNSAITAQTGATLTLQQALTNSGTLTIGGTLDVSALTLNTTAATHIDVNGNSGANGFRKDDLASVQLVDGGTTVNNNATIKHGTLTLTLNSNGTATSGGTVDYGTYYINGGSASLAAIKAVAPSAKVQMMGGCLTIDTNAAAEILHDNTAALEITARQTGSYTGYGRIAFEGISHTSHGGAINLSSSQSLSLDNNGALVFRNNSANGDGGAIENVGSVSLRNNGVVTFAGNRATSHGGAIDNWSGTCILEDNQNVTFSDNLLTSIYGAAIYNSGTLTLRGNGDVLFGKNTEISNGTYRLRSIYSTGTLNLSAAEGKSILFRDSVYASSTVNLNQEGTGDIILTGATTEADLREVKGGTDGTTAEIQNSRTSLFGTMATLYGGRLIVEDGAILNGHGITTAEGANATLRLNNGTLNDGGYAVTIGAGSTLELAGNNAITAATLDLQDGATLSFCLGEQAGSLLSLNGTLQTGDVLKISVTREETESETGIRDSRLLLMLNNAAAYNTQNWTAEKVQVSGAAFSDLIWESGLLLLREEAPEWDVSIGETTTTLTIHGPSSINRAETLAPWTNAERDFTIRGAADDAALAVTPVVQAHSLTAEGVELDLGSAAQQIGTLYIVDATVTSSRTDSSRGFVDGDVVIGTNGMLRLTKFDALGWGGSATDSITLEGSAGEEAVLELGARQTMRTNIALNGYSRITSTAQPTGSGNNVPSFDTYGGRISATGEHNTMEVALSQRAALTIDVAEGGSLEISGDVRPSASGIESGITKTGEGTLLFSGENKSLRNFCQTAGQTCFAGDVVFNGTTGGSLSLSGGAQLDLQGNVVVDDSVQAVGNAQMVFTGDGETAEMQHQIKTTGVDAAAALTVQGFRPFRATLADESNTSLFSINGSVLFRDNTEVTVEDVNSTGWGTGFNVSGNLTFADNGALLFRNLRADVGGAFMVNARGQVTLTGNEQVEFSDNTIGSYGGAFRVHDNGTMAMAGNAHLRFTDNSAGIYGGAISTSGALSITGSEELSFTGNSARDGGAISNNSKQAVLRIANNGSVHFEANTASSKGGALHVGAGNVYLQGNEEVVFSGNKAASLSGAAVYNAGTFTMSDNGDVLFEKNAEVSGSTYRLRSLYSTGTLNLSAAGGKSITFRDGVYASGTVNLNQEGTGDIILTGTTTEADLREVKGGTDGTAAEIQNSRTSEFATMATLYGGRLIVEDGAILNGQGITTAEGANATLRLNNGTLNESGYAVTIGAGSTLELDGRSTVTASALDLQDGATLAFCINGQEESLLNLNGALQTGNTLKLSVSRGEKETGTRDCSILLRLNNAANYNTQNWTAQKVQVSGASFSDLIWANGQLLLREQEPEWDVGIGETATTLTIHGPSFIGFGATMTPWTNSSRDFIIRGAAEDASLTFSPAVAAKSLTTEGVNLDFDAKRQNIGSLIIRDAVVTSSCTNNSRGFMNGEVTIGTGGTLRLTKIDALGWNTTAIPRITMEGESGHEAVLELGARQTMTTQLVLNGNSVVRHTESPTGSGNNVPCFDSFGGAITATGDNNRIEVGLTQRQNMTVTVEAAGELEMSGGIVTSSNGNSGSFSKEGSGALRFTAQEALAISHYIQNSGTTEFSGVQTTVNGYTQNGGTLQVEGQTTLRGQTAVNGGRITIGEGESAALHLQNTTLNMAQGSELQAGGIIHMAADATGALALSGDVTLSSDGLSGQDGTYAVLNHADVQVLRDAAISNVRMENTLMDLAESCSVNLSHVILAATARLTDEPATAHLNDVTAELVVGVNTTVTGHSTLSAGSTLVQNGQAALTLTLADHTSVTQLESASFDSLTLTGTSLVLELRGYESEMHNYATFIALSFTSGTDYATFDAALPVLLSTDGEHYAQAYHLQNGDGTTLFFDSRAAGMVPEPATATLSLLTLAALAARRRRHG